MEKCESCGKPFHVEYKLGMPGTKEKRTNYLSILVNTQ